MERPFFLFWVIVLGTLMLSSNASAQNVEKKFIDDLCVCMEYIDSTQTLKKIEEAYDNCVSVAAAVNRAALAKAIDKQKKYKTGEEYIHSIVVKAFAKCEAYRLLSQKIDRENDDTKDLTGETHEVPAECMMVHEGTFYDITESSDTFYISRKDGVQYEGVLGQSLYLRSDIKWINECTYEVTLQEVNEPKKMPSFVKGEILTVYITSVRGNRYSYFTQVEGRNFTSDMTKVSDEFYDPTKK